MDAIAESVDLIAAGNPPRIVQDESQANYDPPCENEHGQIDWSQPAGQVYNRIRGCDPQPGAYTFWQGKTVRLYDCRLQPASGNAAPGQIVEVGDEQVSIAALGGTIMAKKMRGEGKKVTAAEVAKEAGFSVMSANSARGPALSLMRTSASSASESTRVSAEASAKA